MREVKEPMIVRAQHVYGAVKNRLPHSRTALLLFGALLSLGLSGIVAVWNIASGPLHNLNDIGSWHNRLLFIAMTAAVQAALHLLLTVLYRGGYARLLLRHATLLAGFVIALLAINQKTYAFVEQMLPLVRQMDAQGLAAIGGMKTNLSSSALTLVYMLTRGPIYDMYLVKLACIAAFLALCVMALYMADKSMPGIRAEVFFAFCLILPQGFMSAACAAQMDVIAVALLAASWLMILGEKPHAWIGMVLYAMAAAVSGVCLYALPVYAAFLLRGRIKGVQMLTALALLVVMQTPAILAGQDALSALTSPLRSVIGVPEYAAGAPNIMNLFPRAAMEEMPEYFLISNLPAIDPITNASPYYTSTHFDTLMRGVALMGIAAYALIWQQILAKPIGQMVKAFAALLGALLVAPGASAGMWIAVSVMALWVMMNVPSYRISACLILFATAGAAAYPVTGEVLLPMIIAMLLCLLALFDLLGMFDANKKERIGA